ncbi:DUF4405 domain-containing protein [Rhizobium sp. S153]|uniref:DUF4405 domain-containing protein n=1 Tax=Ciceribacter sichuanensis TaxID=2949647 RepID=A0ABT0VE92_9HYPH|nr:DUF4405 domain-containing protein [Ciceribacter sp. S153]MCM2404222.1 DUF4405 domain-containing protein [Ciceribacter sp. S153]
MKMILVNRLALPAGMAVFLFLSLAYWWLDNLPHEIFGTALFAMIAWHIGVNRFWFKNLFRARYDVRRILIVLLHVALIANMAVLLVTSLFISKSVLAFLPIPDSIYLRDIHWFSAYWAMMIVGIHLGLHWTRVMALVRTALNISAPNVVRTWALRLAAVALAGFGLWSFSVLGVWAKLTFTYSLDFWNFTAAVTPFFWHWVAVVALPAIVVHYAAGLRKKRTRAVAAGNRASFGSKLEGSESAYQA